MNKRTFITIGVVLLLILVGAAIYFLFFVPKGPGLTAEPGGNPFGEAGNAPVTTTPASPEDGSGASKEVAPNLFKITDGPVAYGSLARNILTKVDVPTEEGTSTGTTTQSISSTEIFYIERQSGNVYKYSSSNRTSTRLSNRTLPGVTEAIWTPDGATALLRFLTAREDGEPSIDTYVLPIEAEGGFLLESGLDQVVLSGTSTVVTLLPSTTGSIATTARTDGTGAKTLFTSNLSSLRIFPAGKGLAAYTKASSHMDGFGFLVSATGVFDRILGPNRGLTLLPSPSGKSVIYSYLSGKTITAGVLNTATRVITNLPITILPEKCVWSKNEISVYCAVPRTMSAGWPDAWYQGMLSFSDRIWRIDLEARNAVLVVDPVTIANTPVDGVSLTIDPDSDYLVFTNKKDGSLWAYDL